MKTPNVRYKTARTLLFKNRLILNSSIDLFEVVDFGRNLKVTMAAIIVNNGQLISHW